MEKRILDYITAHPHSSANAVAQTLDLPGLSVLKVIHELKGRSYLKLDTPAPLSPTNDSSNYFSATGKHFSKYEDEN